MPILVSLGWNSSLHFSAFSCGICSIEISFPFNCFYSGAHGNGVIRHLVLECLNPRYFTVNLSILTGSFLLHSYHVRDPLQGRALRWFDYESKVQERYWKEWIIFFPSAFRFDIENAKHYHRISPFFSLLFITKSGFQFQERIRPNAVVRCLEAKTKRKKSVSGDRKDWVWGSGPRIDE